MVFCRGHKYHLYRKLTSLKNHVYTTLYHTHSWCVASNLGASRDLFLRSFVITVKGPDDIIWNNFCLAKMMSDLCEKFGYFDEMRMNIRGIKKKLWLESLTKDSCYATGIFKRIIMNYNPSIYRFELACYPCLIQWVWQQEPTLNSSSPCALILRVHTT